MTYMLGKTPARPDAVSLKFGTFFDTRKLALPRGGFGHYGLGAGLPWGMLGNDKAGNCVWAGQAHASMLWTHRSGAGVPAPFSTASVLSDYSDATGYDPRRPSTDQGTDMQEAASYWRKIGVLDAVGERHKIDSYLALRPDDPEQQLLACSVLGAVGVGVELPANAPDLFDRGQRWTAANLSKHKVGGHYILLVGRNSMGDALVVTWGRLQAVEPEAISMICDEATAYVSFEQLQGKLSPEGFDADGLRAALHTIGSIA